MTKLRHILAASAVVLIFFGIAAWTYFHFSEQPTEGSLPMYLTWESDPTTTMTICWLSKMKPTDGVAPFVFYRVRNEDVWRRAEGVAEPFPNTDQSLHRVELTKLKPDTRYEFLASGVDESFDFRTMPATLDAPLKFIEGGDVAGEYELLDRMNKLAGERDPAFVVWGGDIAYDHGSPARANRWIRLFQSVHHNLRAPDGRLIPILAAIGNHEVNLRGDARYAEKLPRDAEKRIALARGYNAAFRFPGDPAYGTLDFGDYMSLVMLDSGHLSPIAGSQTEWLAKELRERRGRPNVFPVYHVPAYPAHGELGDFQSRDVRENWVPLFESEGLHLAFEHHGHTFKITHPIRDGKVDTNGVVYVGDGAWGVEPRTFHPVAETWYLANADQVQHLHEITLSRGKRDIESIAVDGTSLNRFSQDTTNQGSP